MTHNVDAIYDHGKLVPIVPLLLPQGARVHLRIEEENASSDLQVPILPHSPAAKSDMQVQDMAESSDFADLQPRDEWERGLFDAATDCGVSLPNSALSSDGLFE